MGARLPLRAVAAALMLALVGVVPRGEEASRRTGEAGHRKTHAGISWADATLVEPRPERAEAAGFDEERVWSGGDDWEPHVAADPVRPYVYQFTTRWIAPNYTVVARRSTDGGATWDSDTVLFPSGKPQADPYARVAEDGTVYVVWMEVWDTMLARSDDFGLTWSPPVEVAPGLPFTDLPSLALSPSGQDVYVALNASDSWVVASHDFGRSFGPPVQTSSDNRYYFHRGGAVAPDGTVYFGATHYAQSYQGDVVVQVLRSTDGGASWDSIDVDVSKELPDCPWSPGCFFGFLGPTASVAVDASGTAMVIYNAGVEPGAPQQIWVRASSDGGVSWTPRRLVSRPNRATDNSFPAGAVGATPGGCRIVWQPDRR